MLSAIWRTLNTWIERLMRVVGMYNPPCPSPCSFISLTSSMRDFLTKILLLVSQRPWRESCCGGIPAADWSITGSIPGDYQKTRRHRNPTPSHGNEIRKGKNHKQNNGKFPR